MNIFQTGDILIPSGIDLTKWSTVACDQYTSEPDYWQQVNTITQKSPSAYHITFPEIYLGTGDEEIRIKNINDTMQFYLDSGYFRTEQDALIYVKRDLGNGTVRHGIVGCVDLEAYDFHKGSQSYIRATEGTVLERIPPRVKIRENAVLELPHVMLLIDDADCSVIEPLEPMTVEMESVYDFELMQDSGHLTGYKIPAEETGRIMSALERLAGQVEFEKKYNIKDKGVLLFAVGDGNHSLATAKTCWEMLKPHLSDAERETHPARFALVEVVNIHDTSLVFEPIHRVVFGVDPAHMIDSFMKFYGNRVSKTDNGGQNIKYTYGGSKQCNLYVKDAPSRLAVGTLQMFLDYYISEYGGKVDYIHGDDVVKTLSCEKGNIGFYLPCMEKSELFPTVITDGALPRKTFSMGEAKEKRFYCECKKIK